MFLSVITRDSPNGAGIHLWVKSPSAWLEIRMLQSFLGFNLSFLDSDL